MFYVIENKYVGPNADQNLNATTIEISAEPARKNMSGEVCVKGWCGTTNDWCVNAHGEFSSAEDARAAIHAVFGDVRDSDQYGETFESEDETVVEVYKPGKYDQMSSQETADWIDLSEVEAGMTGDDIALLIAELESEANQHGTTLHGDLEEFINERIEELRTENI